MERRRDEQMKGGLQGGLKGEMEKCRTCGRKRRDWMMDKRRINCINYIRYEEMDADSDGGIEVWMDANRYEGINKSGRIHGWRNRRDEWIER